MRRAPGEAAEAGCGVITQPEPQRQLLLKELKAVASPFPSFFTQLTQLTNSPQLFNQLPTFIKMASTTSTSTLESIQNTASDAVNYVKETVNEYTASASKEGNKEVAKGHTDASVSDRLSAGLNAAGDKIDESSSSAKADAYKESAKH